MTALLVLYMVNQLLLPGHVEQVAGFGAGVDPIVCGLLAQLFGGALQRVLAGRADQPLRPSAMMLEVER